MRPHAHVVQLGKICDSSLVGDAARVDHARADVIDELFLKQLLAVVNTVEHLTHGDRRGGVPANQAKTLLQFRRDGILQPEEVGGARAFFQSRCFNRSESVMRVMQEKQIGPNSLRSRTNPRRMIQVKLGRPQMLRRGVLSAGS